MIDGKMPHSTPISRTFSMGSIFMPVTYAASSDVSSGQSSETLTPRTRDRLADMRRYLPACYDVVHVLAGAAHLPGYGGALHVPVDHEFLDLFFGLCCCHG
jgi:hypothetical protein